MLRTDLEIDLVETLVQKRYGSALEALLADLRPVFLRHGLDADDSHLIEHSIQPLPQERLWGPAKEEVLLGGPF